MAEKVGGLQGEQFSPCTLSSASEPPCCMAPRPDGFVLQPPCSQPCSFVLPTHLHHHIPPSAQLSPAALSGMLARSLKGGVEEGWTSPPSLVPHHDHSSPTAMLHTPVTSRLRSPIPAAASPGPHCRKGPEGLGEPSRNDSTAAIPLGSHPISRMMLKGIISREMQDGDGKSLARRKSPPPASALTRFPGQCPGTDTRSWHSPPCPCAGTPAKTAAGAAVTPAAPPSFTAKARPRPSASREENGKKIPCGRSQGERAGGAGGAGRCGGAHTRVHTHTALHIAVHTHTQPHTHPLSLHHCRCTSSIFCAPAPTRQGAGSALRAPRSPRSHQPPPARAGGTGHRAGEARRGRAAGPGSRGVRSAPTPRARQMRLPRHRHGVSGDWPVPSPA